MATNKQIPNGDLITVTGTLDGSINGVAINGTVTGTANRITGHVTNIYHDVDPAIGQELSQIVLGLTIVCANMAVEVGGAKNLDSLVPMQTIQRLATFRLSSHTMQCQQTVEWPEPNVAVVHMVYSGSLPSFSKSSLPIPDVVSQFLPTGNNTILQSGTTQATFDAIPQALIVDIKYTIDGPEIPWPPAVLQALENANNTSSYDEKTREITYNTDVRML